MLEDRKCFECFGSFWGWWKRKMNRNFQNSRLVGTKISNKVFLKQIIKKPNEKSSSFCNQSFLNWLKSAVSRGFNVCWPILLPLFKGREGGVIRGVNRCKNNKKLISGSCFHRMKNSRSEMWFFLFLGLPVCCFPSSKSKLLMGVTVQRLITRWVQKIFKNIRFFFQIIFFTIFPYSLT